MISGLTPLRRLEIDRPDHPGLVTVGPGGPAKLLQLRFRDGPRIEVPPAIRCGLRVVTERPGRSRGVGMVEERVAAAVRLGAAVENSVKSAVSAVGGILALAARRIGGREPGQGFGQIETRDADPSVGHAVV